MFKRPDDQYKVGQAPEMIKQLEREKAAAKVANKCKGSTIKNYKQLDFQNHPHAAVLTHTCNLEKDHLGWCQCICGIRFAKIG